MGLKMNPPKKKCGTTVLKITIICRFQFILQSSSYFRYFDFLSLLEHKRGKNNFLQENPSFCISSKGLCETQSRNYNDININSVDPHRA